MAFSLRKLSPVGRIALGLVSQMVTIVLLLAILFGVIPDQIESARKVRAVLSESLAQQTASLLQSGDTARLEATLRGALERYDDLRSLAVREANGNIITEAGPHRQLWQSPDNGGAHLDNIAVPITADKLVWGNVEFGFHSAYPESLSGWLTYPPIATVLLIAFLGMITFYLYLRRALEYLDPLSVIPERVRTAYDTFKEAILVVDPKGRVVLANTAFRNLHPAADANLTGKPASSLGWLIAGMPMGDAPHPWLQAMESKATINDIAMKIEVPGQNHATEVVLNCTPIIDGYGQSRGSMVILSDVTALQRSNRELQRALNELAESKREIEEKNLELETLATRDPMTGCLNRRAMYALVEPLFATIVERGTDICCVMGDIDHFKKFNDTYGHAIGDLVIKAFASTIGSGLRDADILCRFGGEEFCIFLPSVTSEQAWQIIERVRNAVEMEAGRSIRDQEGLRITASFGVASIKDGAAKPDALIELADQALYHAKRTGRNRVCVWSPEVCEEEPAAAAQ